LNKVTDNLQQLRLQIQNSDEIEGSRNPLNEDLGDPSSPINREGISNEVFPNTHPQESKSLDTSLSTDLVKRLDEVLEECKVLKALIERKHISTPGLLNSTAPLTLHKYSPLEVSGLLTQNKVAALEKQKLRLDIPQDIRPPVRKAIRPTVSAPTTPLRLSSRSPPIAPKSPERSASPHIKTIEEVIEKEHEDRAYRNLCDEEVFSQSVTILDDEDDSQKGVKSSMPRVLFGNTGNIGTTGTGNKDRHYFGSRYNLFGLKKNLIAEGEFRMWV
jgi:hypothetical protein